MICRVMSGTIIGVGFIKYVTDGCDGRRYILAMIFLVWELLNVRRKAGGLDLLCECYSRSSYYEGPY